MIVFNDISENISQINNILKNHNIDIMRAAGLDVGTKNIGVAIANNNISYPLINITYAKNANSVNQALTAINDLATITKVYEVISNYTVNVVIFGLPLSKDGSYNHQCELTSNFIDNLATIHNHRNPQKTICCFPWDERYTTQEAIKSIAYINHEQSFDHKNNFRKTRKSIYTNISKTKVDSMAASILLQSAIDNINNNKNH